MGFLAGMADAKPVPALFSAKTSLVSSHDRLSFPPAPIGCWVACANGTTEPSWGCYLSTPEACCTKLKRLACQGSSAESVSCDDGTHIADC